MPEPTAERWRLPAAKRLETADLALWGLIGLAVTSIVIRPVVILLHAPHFLLNVDALITPAMAGVVLAWALTRWRSLRFAERLMTCSAAMMMTSVALSWMVGDPHSLASLALGGALVPLLPLSLYLAVMATHADTTDLARLTLVSMVLVQLAVGVVQYVALRVAQIAPGGADLVDGTTSHNFWPVFALPACAALMLTSRDRYRLFWPIPVILLAIYAEAKAALVIWLPLLVVAVAILAFRTAVDHLRGPHPSRLTNAGSHLDLRARQGFAVATLALIGLGIWWTPSVQGTWDVFLGHSRTLQEFTTTGEAGDATQPTLDDAIDLTTEHVMATPDAFLFGLGPGNSTTHAAEILARGSKNGVALPPPGPVARQLVAGEDVIHFRDAQSTLLGIWGDLGTIGAVIYLLNCAIAATLLLLATWRRHKNALRAWSIPAVIGGTLVGGVLLDWPEQSSVVIPTALVVVVLAGSASERPSAFDRPSAERGFRVIGGAGACDGVRSPAHRA
ncbi:MAG: hypothetical protein ACRDWY_04820 [Actinomycetes bacterium]